MRSRFTARLIGSMVLWSFASSMQARTGSPFTRTAQDPHWPEAQEYRYPSVGSTVSRITWSTLRTRAPSFTVTENDWK